MRCGSALAAHDEVLRRAIEAHGGFFSATPVTVSWRHSRRRCQRSTPRSTPNWNFSCRCEWDRDRRSRTS